LGLKVSLKPQRFFVNRKTQRQICLQTLLRKPIENFGVLKTSVNQPQEQPKTLRHRLVGAGAEFGVLV